MTLTGMLIGVGIVALIFTIVMLIFKGDIKNWVLSYIQNFTGVLFIFSGLVKAVDPLGTAYKMQDYFGEFEATFSETWFSFIVPIFPWFSEHAIAVSVIMIVFELALGVMLIIGYMRKTTAWLFLGLIVFFLALTGYTYLTGYVPNDVNFFQFTKWGPWVETSMKVTDCGCFGDFLVLKPFTSFMKDVFLMIPALIFVFMTNKMHQVFSKGARTLITLATIVGFTFYCISNYVWDIPDVDFRPFREDVNIPQIRTAEEEAEADVEVLAYEMTNKETGEFVRLPFREYMKDYKKYPKEKWNLDQIKSESAIKETKISHFDLESIEGEEVQDELLADENYSFLIVAYRLYGSESQTTVIEYDTTYRVDTIQLLDTIRLEQKIDNIEKRQVVKPVYSWDEDFVQHWTGTINPVMNAAKEAGYKIHAATAYSDWDRIQDFSKSTGSDYPFYMADDIMLKTIIRSNPGIVLFKNGTIVKKWHYKKLPHFEVIKEEYMK